MLLNLIVFLTPPRHFLKNTSSNHKCLPKLSRIYILTSRLNSAQPTIGQGSELNAIAAVVLGGASLSGGRGSIIGTFLGAMLMGFINNGMNILNISPFYQEAVKGLVISVAVLIEREKNV